MSNITSPYFAMSGGRKMSNAKQICLQQMTEILFMIKIVVKGLTKQIFGYGICTNIDLV